MLLNNQWLNNYLILGIANAVCHDAQGDVMGDMFDGLVAFKLDCLPDTEGKTVKLLLKWNSFSGPKQVELDYCTRRDSHNPTTAIVDQLPTLKLK